MLVVKLAGSDDTVTGNEGNNCDRPDFWATRGCGIYTWDFVFAYHPLAVTLFSLSLTRAVSSPESSLVVRVLRPPSRDWLCFSASVVCWFSCISWSTWTPSDQPYFYLATALGGITLVFGGIALFLGCGHCRQLQLTYSMGAQRFRPVDRKRRRRLFWSGFDIFSVRFIFDVVLVIVRARQDISHEFEKMCTTTKCLCPHLTC